MGHWFHQRVIATMIVALTLTLLLNLPTAFFQHAVTSPVHAQAMTQSSLSIGSESTYLTASQLQGKQNGFNYNDAPLGCLSAGNGQVDCYGSNPSVSPNDTFKSTGTPNDPLNTIDYNTTTISGEPSACSYVNISSVYKDPSSGTLLGFGHCERWPQGNGAHFWASIFLASSTNNGASWVWQDEIVQHASAYNPNATPGFNEAGPGAYLLYNPPDDPNMTYFYVYMEDQYNGTNYITVARAPVAAVINAVNNRTTLPSFMRWYGNSWNQQAAWINGHSGAPQGGYFQDVGLTLPGDNAPDSVIYDSTLGQYVLGVRSVNGSLFQIDLATSANPVDFSTADGATVYSVTNSSVNAVYSSFVGDPTAPETQANSDGSFTMYYTAWPVGSSLGSNQTYTAKRVITVGSGQVSGQHKFQIADNKVTLDVQMTNDNYTPCNCGVYNLAASPDGTNASQQQWNFVNVGGNQYKLETTVNNTTFDVQITGDNYTPCNCGAYNVAATPDSWASPPHEWTLVSLGNNHYKLQIVANNTILDLQITGESYTPCNCGAYNVAATPDSWNAPGQVWTLV